MAVHSLEGSLTLREAAKLLPGRPHLNTLRRWASKGTRGARLRTFRSGHLVCTTREYIDQFLTECSAGSYSESQPSESHLAAEAKLDALGVSS